MGITLSKIQDIRNVNNKCFVLTINNHVSIFIYSF